MSYDMGRCYNVTPTGWRMYNLWLIFFSTCHWIGLLISFLFQFQSQIPILDLYGHLFSKQLYQGWVISDQGIPDESSIYDSFKSYSEIIFNFCGVDFYPVESTNVIIGRLVNQLVITVDDGSGCGLPCTQPWLLPSGNVHFLLQFYLTYYYRRIFGTTNDSLLFWWVINDLIWEIVLYVWYHWANSRRMSLWRGSSFSFWPLTSWLILFFIDFGGLKNKILGSTNNGVLLNSFCE